MFKQLIILFLSLISSTALAFSYTMEITEQQLQKTIEAYMPLTKEDAFFSVTIANPIIELIKSSNKIGLHTTIKVAALGNIEGNGKARIAGNLSYNAKKAAFYLQNIEIIDLQIDQVASQHINAIKLTTQNLLNQMLKNQPVYILNDKKFEEELAKSMLQSIEVKEGKLMLLLGSNS